MDANELFTTDFIDTAPAAKICPGRPALCVVWRWMAKGIKNRSTGQVVQLQHIRVGGKLLTTAKWIADFVEVQSTAAPVETAPRPKPTSRTIRRPTPKQRARQIAQAKEALRLS